MFTRREEVLSESSIQQVALWLVCGAYTGCGPPNSGPMQSRPPPHPAALLVAQAAPCAALAMADAAVSAGGEEEPFAVELQHAIGFAGGVRDAVRWTPGGSHLVWPAGAVAGAHQATLAPLSGALVASSCAA